MNAAYANGEMPPNINKIDNIYYIFCLTRMATKNNPATRAGLWKPLKSA